MTSPVGAGLCRSPAAATGGGNLGVAGGHNQEEISERASADLSLQLSAKTLFLNELLALVGKTALKKHEVVAKQYKTPERHARTWFVQFLSFVATRCLATL